MKGTRKKKKKSAQACTFSHDSVSRIQRFWILAFSLFSLFLALFLSIFFYFHFHFHSFFFRSMSIWGPHFLYFSLSSLHKYHHLFRMLFFQMVKEYCNFNKIKTSIIFWEINLLKSTLSNNNKKKRMRNKRGGE